MNSLNSILIEGNLVRDPEFKETPKGTSLCTFSVASNRFFRQNEETVKEVSFFNVETWSKNFPDGTIVSIICHCPGADADSDSCKFQNGNPNLCSGSSPGCIETS